MTTTVHPHDTTSITTGIPALDAAWGGPSPSEIALLTGIGADEAGIALALEAAHAGQPVFLFTCRRACREVVARALSRATGIPLGEVERLGGRHARAIDAAACALADLPLFCAGEAPRTVRDLTGAVAPSWFIERTPLVVIEDVSALEPTVVSGPFEEGDHGAGESLRAQARLARNARDLARDLKRTAWALRCPLIVCAPTGDAADARAAQRALALSMLADTILICEGPRCDAQGGRCVPVTVDRGRGDAAGAVALPLWPLGKDSGVARGSFPSLQDDEEDWGAFALRETA